MSLLNKTNKDNPRSSAIDQLVELLEENILIDKCSIEDGILYIQNSDRLDNIYLTSDLLELMAGKDSEIAKLAGIREVYFHKSVSVVINDDVQLDRNIVFKTQFDIFLGKKPEIIFADVRGINASCFRFIADGNGLVVKDSIIEAKSIVETNKCRLINCKKLI